MTKLIQADLLWENINKAGSTATPFVFAVDYEMDKAYFSLHPKSDCEIYWDIEGEGNSKFIKNTNTDKLLTLESYPISLQDYTKSFNTIQSHLQKGNTFLANLTIPTPIKTNCTIEDIFCRSKSRFKLLIPNKLVCFSPEIFINIDSDGRICSFPMKGTISGSIPNAEEVILKDYKETAEHYTIVDFIRADLSRVSSNINVDRLRYIDRLHTSKGEILQVSSQISGILPYDWKTNLGFILRELLPAGSISGAPKQATLRAIEEAELDRRGFYTGVFGYFDGKELKTAVMIRYIEQDEEGGLTFRSGGGITINSNCKEEYKEVISKVYLQV